jgi:hypothetical protein
MLGQSVQGYIRYKHRLLRNSSAVFICCFSILRVLLGGNMQVGKKLRMQMRRGNFIPSFSPRHNFRLVGGGEMGGGGGRDGMRAVDY